MMTRATDDGRYLNVSGILEASARHGTVRKTYERQLEERHRRQSQPCTYQSYQVVSHSSRRDCVPVQAAIQSKLQSYSPIVNDEGGNFL